MAAIRPLALDDVDPKLRETLQPVVDRLGYFGEFFQYGGHAPGVVAGFMHYSGALKGAIPDDINETIALTVCSHLGFAYERIQHERLALKLGFDRDWIASLVGRASAAQLTPAQLCARDLSLAILDDRVAEARAVVERLAAETSEAIAVAALFQITRFRDVCTVGRLFDMQIPVPSIFADDRLQHPG